MGNAELYLRRVQRPWPSGVTKGGGAVAPGRSRRGAQKQPHQKYFNDHKIEFDEVCWMSQQ